MVLCTLLGPEGPGLHRLVWIGPLGRLTWKSHGFRTLVLPALVGDGGYRPYFENYTVDASILDTTGSMYVLRGGVTYN